MPLDPRIPLQTQLPSYRPPLQTLGALAELDQRDQIAEQRQAMAEQRRRALEDDEAIRTTLQQTGNPDLAIESLFRQGRSGAAGALSKSVHDWRKEQAEQIKRDADNAHAATKLATQIFQGVTDQSSYTAAKKAAASFVPKEFMADLPELYDAQAVAQVVSFGTGRTQFLKQQRDAIDDAHKALERERADAKNADDYLKNRREAWEHWQKAASGFFSSARNQQEWDRATQMLTLGGAPPDLLAGYGRQFSPAAAARARDLSMTPKERADVAHQQVTEDQAQQQINLRKQEVAQNPQKDMNTRAHAQAERWKQAQYGAIEKDLREWVAENGDPTPEMLGEIADRKLRVEDSFRDQVGLPPLLEAEYALVSDPSKVAQLEKVRNAYRSITGEDTLLVRMEKLKGQITSATDEAKREALKKDLLTLRNKYRERTGR